MPHIQSMYPPVPAIPETMNVHDFLFRRPGLEMPPDFTMFVDGINGQERTRDEFFQRVRDAATALAAMGLSGKKDVVAIFSPNCLEYITLTHALLYITTPFALFSSFSTPTELAHCFNSSHATKLFVHASLLDIARKAAKKVSFSEKNIYILEGTAPKKQTLDDLIESARQRQLKTVDVRPAVPRKPAYLVFSSGTSGIPKVLYVSHHNINFTNAQALVMAQEYLTISGPPPTSQHPTGYPVTLTVLPFYHAYGYHAFHQRIFLVPTVVIIIPKWSVNDAIKIIPKYKVSSLALVPSMVHQLAHSPQATPETLASINGFGSGAAYLHPRTSEKMKSLLRKDAASAEGYGLSECTLSAISRPLPGMLGGRVHYSETCTGILNAGMQARIVRDDGTDAEFNEPGELLLKGGNVVLGYGDKKATKETFLPDGWVRTGDRFTVDPYGNFFFQDRGKDTLKVSGIQVSPAEIEHCLMTHPDRLLVDATVAGVSLSKGADNKVPRAWVVLSDIGCKRGANTVRSDLERWVQDSLSKYKWLRGGIEVVDEIPKSPTGKVLRRVLVDKYVQDRKSRAKL